MGPTKFTTLEVTSTSTLTGAVTATAGVTGAVTGNVTGNLTGNVTGNVTGNLTGNVTGNVTGDVVGGLKNTVVAVTADGAITVPTVNKSYFITKAGVAAMTIADPTATTHDGVRLTFISTTANAHTLSNAAGSGFFSSGGGSKDIGTFGGAIGDGIVIEAYQGKWYIVPGGSLNVTLG